MVHWNIKQIHNISRPGEVPARGDVVEIECVGGYVLEVDPETRQCREAHQQFRLGANGQLAILHRLNPSR